MVLPKFLESMSCRTLISNAVRKKHYYKEAIRVEVLPSGQEVDENKPWSGWDPISSGEGDLLLDDLAKAFSNASTKASKPVKAIDFASVIDSMPSLGFQVNDLISGTNVAVPKPLATRKNIVSAVKLNAQSVATDGVREHPDRLCFSQPGQSVLCEPLEQQRFESENPQKLYSSCDTTKAVNNNMEIEDPTITTGVEPKNPDGTDEITTEIHNVQSQTYVIAKASNDVMEIEVPTTTTGAGPTNPAETDGITTEFHDLESQKSGTAKTSNDAMEIEAPTTTGMEPTNPDGIDGVATEVHDVHSQRHMTNCELDVVPPHYNITFHSLDIGFGVASNPDSEVQVPTNYQDSDIPAPHNEEANSDKSGDIQSDLIDGILTGKEEKSFPLNSAFDKSISEIEEELRESGDDVVVLANQVPVLESNDEMTITDDYSLANHGTQEMTMEEQEHEKADGKLSYPALAQSESGMTSLIMRVFQLIFPFLCNYDILFRSEFCCYAV